MLPSDKIHWGAQNYHDTFCKYAGITFIPDAHGSSGLWVYDNPIVNGKIRWSYSLYGDIAGCYASDVDDLHYKVMSNALGIPKEYMTQCSLDGWLITRHGFDRWLNDQLLLLEEKKK